MVISASQIITFFRHFLILFQVGKNGRFEMKNSYKKNTTKLNVSLLIYRKKVFIGSG